MKANISLLSIGILFRFLVMLERFGLLVSLDISGYKLSRHETIRVIQLNYCLKNFRIDALRRIVGSSVLTPHHAANLDHSAGEFFPGVRIGHRKRRIADCNVADIALVNVNANPQCAYISHHYNRVAAGRHIFADTIFHLKDFAINGRAYCQLIKICFCLVSTRFSCHKSALIDFRLLPSLVKFVSGGGSAFCYLLSAAKLFRRHLCPRFRCSKIGSGGLKRCSFWCIIKLY